MKFEMSYMALVCVLLQFFLSNRAVYLLLWTTRLGFEHAGLEFWLSSIRCHAPKAPIFVIGTHRDQVPKAELPQAKLKRRYPQIRGFHFVSSITGQVADASVNTVLMMPGHQLCSDIPHLPAKCT